MQNLLNSLTKDESRKVESTYENNTNTITTLEIAEMLEMKHWQILRKLDGTKTAKGIIQILSDNKIVVADYFIKSSYTDEQEKERPCYKVTKLGCDFLANKFNGENGIIFTAKYVKRFNDMEQELQQPKQPELAEKERFLLKNSKTWFQRNNWKMKMICDGFGWERKYLYHKILSELSDIYNLGAIERMYENINGHKPKYKMDLMDYFYPLQVTADKYIDYLLEETE